MDGMDGLPNLVMDAQLARAKRLEGVQQHALRRKTPVISSSSSLAANRSPSPPPVYHPPFLLHAHFLFIVHQFNTPVGICD